MIPSTLMTQTMLMTTDQNEVTIYFLTLSLCHPAKRRISGSVFTTEGTESHRVFFYYILRYEFC